MRLGILGAGGFIGTNMVDYLLRETTYEMVAMDRDFDKLAEVRSQAPGFEARVRTVVGDINSDEHLIHDVAASCDVVVDLVAYATPSTYVSNPLAVVDLNLFDNLKVVRACSQAGTHLIQFSSCEVYGITGGRLEAFSEDEGQFILGPVREQRWIYACAKQLLERMIHAYGLQKSLAYTIIRPFNFIGPRIDYLPEPNSKGGPRVFSHFFSALVHGQPLYLVDDGVAKRSYTYIDDAMEAFRLVLANLGSTCLNQIVNIGHPGNETTIRGLATLMMSLWPNLSGEPLRSDVVSISGRSFYGEGYADCDRRIPDIRRLSSMGWSPRFDLRQTVEYSMRYFLKTVGKGSSEVFG